MIEKYGQRTRLLERQGWTNDVANMQLNLQKSPINDKKSVELSIGKWTYNGSKWIDHKFTMSKKAISDLDKLVQQAKKYLEEKEQK